MKNNFKIAIINDEISNDIRETITFLSNNKIDYVELRTLNGRNLLDVLPEEAREVSKLLGQNNIRVSAIASPLFKWHAAPSNKKPRASKIDTFFFNSSLNEASKKKYILRAMELAKIFHTKYIRIFSGLKNKYSGTIFFYKDPLFIYALKQAKANDITLVLENEPACNIYKLEQMKDLWKKLGSKFNFGLLFDFANFYRVNQHIFSRDLELLKPAIRYFHIKDYNASANQFVSLGRGSINYKRILTDISRIFYNKEIFISLETHVQDNKKVATKESLLNLRELIKNKRIAYAIIGCGRVFKKHADAIIADGKSELRAVFDTNRGRSKKAAINYDCEVKPTLKALLQDPSITTVNICTPHHTHKELIIKTIKAGKTCLCEKPLCLSKKQGRVILEHKTYNGHNVFVVLQNRFNPAIRMLFKLLEQKALGQIKLCSVNVRWWRDNNYFKDEWHGDLQKVGGMLFNQGAHVLDLMLKICGEPKSISQEVKTLRGFTDIDDIYIASIEFKNGIVGNIEITTYTKYHNLESSIFIIGEKGSIKISGPYLNKIEHLSLKSNLPAQALRYSEEKVNIYGDSHARLIKALNDYLLNRKYHPCLATAEEGVKLTEFIEKLYKESR